MIWVISSLIVSVVINIFLYKALKIQLQNVKIYKSLSEDNARNIEYIKIAIYNVYFKMRQLDDKNIFVRDDEVGVVFQELFELLKKLNELVSKI